MEFRVGSPADAEAIAGLIASFQSELTDEPSGAGAEGYLASVSVQSEREYLASERYRYLLAYSDSQLAGFIAIRDGSHLFHLFVERSHQRQGIARRLLNLDNDETPRQIEKSDTLHQVAVRHALPVSQDRARIVLIASLWLRRRCK